MKEETQITITLPESKWQEYALLEEKCKQLAAEYDRAMVAQDIKHGKEIDELNAKWEKDFNAGLVIKATSLCSTTYSISSACENISEILKQAGLDEIEIMNGYPSAIRYKGEYYFSSGTSAAKERLTKLNAEIEIAKTRLAELKGKIGNEIKKTPEKAPKFASFADKLSEILRKMQP